ncbi:MAG TPA: hypothetical protein VIP11_07665 [Gemmatimonadaceae bacterium]
MIDELGTAAALLAVATAEGVRRIPDGSIVLRRIAFGPWRVARIVNLGAGVGVVSLCIPLSLPVVLPDLSVDTSQGTRRIVTQLRARARRARRSLIALRLFGMSILVALVIGVPVATSRYGEWGLVVSAATVMLGTIAQATVAWRALRRLGDTNAVALRRTLPLLSPFGAPRACEVVQTRILTGLPPLVVAHLLLGEEALLREMRPELYDIARDERSTWLDSMGITERVHAFTAQPADSAWRGSFCPRCGTSFHDGFAECSGCEIELRGPRPVGTPTRFRHSANEPS